MRMLTLVLVMFTSAPALLTNPLLQYFPNGAVEIPTTSSLWADFSTKQGFQLWTQEHGMTFEPDGYPAEPVPSFCSQSAPSKSFALFDLGDIKDYSNVHNAYLIIPQNETCDGFSTCEEYLKSRCLSRKFSESICSEPANISLYVSAPHVSTDNEHCNLDATTSLQMGSFILGSGLVNLPLINTYGDALSAHFRVHPMIALGIFVHEYAEKGIILDIKYTLSDGYTEQDINTIIPRFQLGSALDCTVHDLKPHIRPTLAVIHGAAKFRQSWTDPAQQIVSFHNSLLPVKSQLIPLLPECAEPRQAANSNELLAYTVWWGVNRLKIPGYTQPTPGNDTYLSIGDTELFIVARPPQNCHPGPCFTTDHALPACDTLPEFLNIAVRMEANGDYNASYTVPYRRASAERLRIDLTIQWKNIMEQKPDTPYIAVEITMENSIVKFFGECKGNAPIDGEEPGRTDWTYSGFPALVIATATSGRSIISQSGKIDLFSQPLLLADSGTRFMAIRPYNCSRGTWRWSTDPFTYMRRQVKTMLQFMLRFENRLWPGDEVLKATLVVPIKQTCSEASCSKTRLIYPSLYFKYGFTTQQGFHFRGEANFDYIKSTKPSYLTIDVTSWYVKTDNVVRLRERVNWGGGYQVSTACNNEAPENSPQILIHYRPQAADHTEL